MNEPQYQTMENKGWMAPYLADGDSVFGVGRMAWWMDAALTGQIPPEKYKEIQFVHEDSHEVRDGLPVIPKSKGKKAGPPLSASGARKHLDDLVDRMGGGWEAMIHLIDWLAWGLGVGEMAECPKPMFGADWNEFLYTDFELGRLQAADCDVLGGVLSDRHGKGWNPNQFYPTPISVCTMMAQMTMMDTERLEGDDRDPLVLSVNDPCVGTGRMLLAASNYSINLSGMDIDRVMVAACGINMALYAPWAVYLPQLARRLLSRPAVTRGNALAQIEKMDEARVEQGHPAATDGKSEISFNRHGQGELFSVPGQKGDADGTT